MERERSSRWTPEQLAKQAIRWEQIMTMREKRGAEVDELPGQIHRQFMREIDNSSLTFRAYRELKKGQQPQRGMGL